MKLRDHLKLHELGYHALRFEKHDYVMRYCVDDGNACVEGIYHMMQDYENLFADDL